MKTLLSTFLSFIIIPIVAFGQGGTHLFGKVTNRDGNPVVWATVKLSDAKTGKEAYSTTTDAAGNYVFPSKTKSGEYSLFGFKDAGTIWSSPTIVVKLVSGAS